MQKCKNCYHKDICVAFLDGSEIPDCDYFKDKSLIVKLPCKVGDILFAVDYEWGEECIDKVKCYSIEIDDSGMSIYCETVEGSYDTYISDDFEETVFLTREEAEKALEEKKNG